MEWIWIALAAGVLLVRVGQTLHYAGLSRSKNAAGASLRSVADICVSVVAFWAVGQAIEAHVGNHVFGFNPRYLIGWEGMPGNAAFAVALVLVGTGVVGGAVAERSTFVPMAVAWAVLAGVVLPVSWFWVRSGWLKENVRPLL